MLVLEWIDGIKINDYAALDAAGINRFEVAKRTVCAYFYQFFEAGFFHADPHPGNILVKKGSTGEGPIVTFVDFGMVGSLTKHMKRVMKEVFLAYLTRDSHTLVHALSQLGFMTGRVLLTLPRSLEQVIRRLETGQIEVKLGSLGQSKWIGGRGRDNDASPGVGGFAWLFMFVASLGGASSS